MKTDQGFFGNVYLLTKHNMEQFKNEWDLSKKQLLAKLE